MTATMLVITGFQAYWLKETFQKEKRILEQRASFAFRETIRRLQAKKLKLDNFFIDSAKGAGIGVADIKFFPGPPNGEEEIAGLLNNVTISITDSLSRRERIELSGFLSEQAKKVKDSPDIKQEHGKNMIFSLRNPEVMRSRDSARRYLFERTNGPHGEIFRFLYNVDSLQDSLRVSDIDSAFRTTLQAEGIRNVSYSISRSDEPSYFRRGPDERMELNKVIVGFAHPVVYSLHLDSLSGYFAKRMASPFLFSLFLVSVTILSFVLLYRNLLKQRRLTELKNDFISNITHELKTPIATVGVAIEALQNFNALNNPERTKEYLDISKNELNRLSMLVDKVLKLSMFENHELELRKEEFDMRELVNEVAGSFQLQMEKRNAVCNISSAGNNFTVHADKLHITSVLYNLIDNALKYSAENPVIGIELSSKPGQLTLQVKDNGIGIPPEYRSKVFDKFFRVPSGDMHNVKGYGLGLSYVAQVIARHNGTVKVESEPGKGSTFIIVLPAHNP